MLSTHFKLRNSYRDYTMSAAGENSSNELSEMEISELQAQMNENIDLDGDNPEVKRFLTTVNDIAGDVYPGDSMQKFHVTVVTMIRADDSLPSSPYGFAYPLPGGFMVTSFAVFSSEYVAAL